MIRIIIATALALLAAPATAAERKTFYGPNGSFEGTSIVRGPSGSYYNGQGRFSGSSVVRGNQTLYYDHQGRPAGSTINTGPRR